MAIAEQAVLPYRNSPRFYPFDWLIIGYCTLMVLLILAIGRPLRGYFDEMLFYCGVIAIVLVVAHYVDEHRSRLFALVRTGYPVLLFTFFYRETGGLMFLVFGTFFDARLVAFETSVFGIEPTIFIDRHLLNTWVNEIFSFCYVSYYPMLPVFVLMMFIRRDDETARSFLTAVCLTFFLSYLLFFLYPVEGPRWHFADVYIKRIEGPIFRRFAEFVIAHGAVRGGCMPSSHFGVALVLLLYVFRYYRKAGWLLMPVVAGLGIGTVWGRYHYVSDVIVGGLLGAASVIFVWKFYPKWTRANKVPRVERKLSTQHVS